MGQISTRIFDTDRNQPAKGVPVRLERPVAGYDWEMIAGGITDADGSVPHLLADHKRLPQGCV
jgi:5-hydroxyisourate hydrolase-like protein (transthyretin family)